MTNFSLIDFLVLKLPQYNLQIDSLNSHCVHGGHTPIMNYLINIPNLNNAIKSLKKKNIMFIDQVVSVDSLYLLSWKDIQTSTGHKIGRPPNWYFYLRDNFTHYNDHNKSLRLIYEIKSPIMSSNFANRIPTPNKSRHPYKHKNLWVAFWDDTVKEIQYGKLLETYN